MKASNGHKGGRGWVVDDGVVAKGTIFDDVYHPPGTVFFHSAKVLICSVLRRGGVIYGVGSSVGTLLDGPRKVHRGPTKGAWTHG